MFKKLSFCIVVLFVLPVLAEECPRRIVFLPESHMVDQITGQKMAEDQFDPVAESQAKVARYIEGSSKTPVFTEHAAITDFDLENMPKEEVENLQALYTQLFPNGISPNYNVLTKEQKQSLIDVGGDFVQLIREKTRSLRHVIENEEELNKIYKPIVEWAKTNNVSEVPYPPEIGALAYGERERAALRQIKKYFDQNTNHTEVILVFGHDANFSFYPDLFDPKCISTPEEFLPDWRGEKRSGPKGF